jgi:hypothetical protein
MTRDEPSSEDHWEQHREELRWLARLQELITLKVDTHGVRNVVFSPDGHRLASAGGAHSDDLGRHAAPEKP